MRLAVVVVGEPRHFRATTQKFREYIVEKLRADKHQVDVIISCWTTRTPVGEITARHNQFTDRDSTPRIRNYAEHAEIVRMLEPINYTFMEKPNVDVKWFLPHFMPTVNVYGMFCQHLSWRHAARLVTATEEAHGIQYDAIIRTRLDNHFLHPIKLPEVKSIRVPATEGYNGSQFDPNIFVNDQMGLGPRRIMLQMMDVYSHYARLAKLQKRYDLPEHLVCYYLRKLLKCGFELFPLEYRLQRGDYVPS
jgi:hypothetical protein